MQKDTRKLGIKDSIENVCLHPLFNVTTTIMGVFAGILGTKDGALTLCSPIFDNCEFSYVVTSFWIILGCFVIFFAGTFWAQQRRSKKTAYLFHDKANILEQKTNLLSEHIERLYTLPPEGFLVKYMESISNANEAFFVLQETPDPSIEEIEVAIRTILTYIMELARGYDKDGLEANYGCNLMLFISSQDMQNEEAEIENRLKFVDHGVSVRKLNGVLDLILSLSVSTNNTGGPDLNLNDLALPIPCLLTNQSNDDKILLPGAPLAFVKKTATAIESQEDWNSRVEPFSEKVKEELIDFLKVQKKNIQSFISIPLYDEPSFNKEEKQPSGILNIHRNTPNDLLAEKSQLFYPLLVPYIILVGKLLKYYNKEKID